MVTKQQLLNEIDNLVSEYLGFTTSIYGLKSKPKVYIEQYAHNMRRAMVYKRLAQEYKLNANCALYHAITGENSAQYDFWAYLTEVAHLLYWNETESEATKRAYIKVYGQ